MTIWINLLLSGIKESGMRRWKIFNWDKEHLRVPEVDFKKADLDCILTRPSPLSDLYCRIFITAVTHNQFNCANSLCSLECVAIKFWKTKRPWPQKRAEDTVYCSYPQHKCFYLFLLNIFWYHEIWRHSTQISEVC